MEKMLGAIFAIVIGFWLFSVIGKVFLGYWLRKKQRQMEEQMRSGGFTGSFSDGNFKGFYTNSGGNQNTSEKKEGQVTVENTQQPPKSVSSEIGEYVDFEEVKE